MSEGPYTVFAPNDDAFSALCKKLGVTKMDLMTVEKLPAIIKSHIVEGKYMAADMPDGKAKLHLRLPFTSTALKPRRHNHQLSALLEPAAHHPSCA